MKSIQRRLTLLIVGGLLMLAAVSGIGFYFFARWIFTRQFDAALTSKGFALATLVEQDGPATYEMEFTGEQMPEFVSAKSSQYFQVWLPTNEVLRRSPNLGEADLPRFQGAAEKIVVQDLKLPGDRAGRAVRLRFIPNTDNNRTAVGPDKQNARHATVVFARDRAQLDQVLNSLLFITLIAAICIPFLAAALVSVGIRKGLRPVRSLAGEMERINTPLSAMPLPAEIYPDELQPVVLQLNSLLERLKTAFLRERRFTLNASHELRTPLAEACTALEVALKWPEDRALQLEATSDALQSIRHMEVLVTSLLALARGDNGLLEVHTDTLDLIELVRLTWFRLHDKANKCNIRLKLNTEGDGTIVIADRILLKSVLYNLIENAIEYSPNDGAVEVEISNPVGAEAARLTISNTMEIPLTKSDVPHLFEPFWRKDLIRTANRDQTLSGHSGIGLALAKTLCDVMDINIGTQIDHAGRFTMNLTLPLIVRPSQKAAAEI